MLDLARVAPPESVLGKTLRWPLRLLPRGRVLPILSGPLRGWRWVVGVGLHGCWLGTYELRKQRAFAANVQSGQVVYDIGANVGFYALLAARCAGKQGRVFAFEPSPENVPFLRRHVELNRCSRTVVFDCALADKTGEANFDDNACYTGRLTANGGVRVRVEMLDGLLAAGRVLPADVVKIDVEGAELAVLRGGEQFFRRHHPILFLATHSKALHRDCCALLQDWGYDLRPLAEREELDTTDEILAVQREPIEFEPARE